MQQEGNPSSSNNNSGVLFNQTKNQENKENDKKLLSTNNSYSTEEEDDEDDDDFQIENEDDDYDLESFDWIDWNDLVVGVTNENTSNIENQSTKSNTELSNTSTTPTFLPENDDPISITNNEEENDEKKEKRGRRKYKKFEKPSVLPSIKPKSPTSTTKKQQKQTIQPSPFNIPPALIPLPIQSNNLSSTSSKSSKNTSVLPPPSSFPTMFSTNHPSTLIHSTPPIFAFPPEQLMYFRTFSGNLNGFPNSQQPRFLPPNNNTSNNNLKPPSSSETKTNSNTLTSNNQSLLQTVYNNLVTNVFTEEQLIELTNQLQIHVQLLCYNYFLCHCKNEWNEMKNKFKNLINEYLDKKEESIITKNKYFLNCIKDNLPKINNQTIIEDNTINNLTKLLTFTIFNIEGLSNCEIFLNFEFSTLISSENKIQWDSLIKILKPFKLFNNQYLLAEVQESVHNINSSRPIAKRIVFTIPEDNLLLLGLKRFWKPKGIKWEKVTKSLPNKTAKQLRVRFKNMTGKRSTESNPFKQFRLIADENSQQSTNSKDKSSIDNDEDYSHLFESVKLFKVSNKLTRKEAPVDFKELGKSHTYIREREYDGMNNNMLIEDNHNDNDIIENNERKRKQQVEKNENNKKSKQQINGTTLTTTILETTNQNGKEEELNQLNVTPQSINLPETTTISLESSCMSLLNDLIIDSPQKQQQQQTTNQTSTTGFLPIEDVGSIDSSDEDDEEEEQINDDEVMVNGKVYKFSREEDKEILTSLIKKRIPFIDSPATEVHKEVFTQLNKNGVILKQPEIIESRFKRLQLLMKMAKETVAAKNDTIIN
ncbi:hypothetical protein ABK040_010058 [Willaertia magna]